MIDLCRLSLEKPVEKRQFLTVSLEPDCVAPYTVKTVYKNSCWDMCVSSAGLKWEFTWLGSLVGVELGEERLLVFGGNPYLMISLGKKEPGIKCRAAVVCCVQSPLRYSADELYRRKCIPEPLEVLGRGDHELPAVNIDWCGLKTVEQGTLSLR